LAVFQTCTELLISKLLRQTWCSVATSVTVFYLKMGPENSSEILVPLYQITRHHIVEERDLNTARTSDLTWACLLLYIAFCVDYTRVFISYFFICTLVRYITNKLIISLAIRWFYVAKYFPLIAQLGKSHDITPFIFEILILDSPLLYKEHLCSGLF
jgi:hypothetical protein